MRELDKKFVYDLSELTSEELIEVLTWLKQNDVDWIDCTSEEMNKYQETDRLVYNSYNWHWSDTIEPTYNAKELFYTLENVQVDCRGLTEEQIKDIAGVFKINGFKYCENDEEESLRIDYIAGCYYLQLSYKNELLIDAIEENKNTITYEKFMELFGSEESNFKILVDVLNDELTEEAYKGAKYEVKYIAEKPKQYQIGIDTFQRCEANMTKEDILACCKFNIDKYNWRNKGQDLEDLEKIISYANWGIKQLKQQ